MDMMPNLSYYEHYAVTVELLSCGVFSQCTFCIDKTLCHLTIKYNGGHVAQLLCYIACHTGLIIII